MNSFQKPFNYVMSKTQKPSTEFFTVLSALLNRSEFGSAKRSGAFGGKDYVQNCHRVLKEDMAMVTVKMSSTVYTLSTRSARNTFADKVT